MAKDKKCEVSARIFTREKYAGSKGNWRDYHRVGDVEVKVYKGAKSQYLILKQEYEEHKAPTGIHGNPPLQYRRRFELRMSFSTCTEIIRALSEAKLLNVTVDG